MRLVLASGSPRRSDVLRMLGFDFEVSPPEIDETRYPDEVPASYVERMAWSKAELKADEGLVVIGADTVVVHDGRVLGKPGHPEEARTMLRSLQGDSHEVLTGLAVARWEGGPIVESVVDATAVTMLAMTEEEICDYVSSGEPVDKAGAYAIQGVGGQFVGSITGSPFTAVGLPIHLLPRLLGRSGSHPAAFRR